MRGGRPEVVAERHVEHRVPVEVETREVPVHLGDQGVVLLGEAQLRQVVVPVLRYLARVALEAVVAVPDVEHGRRVEDVDVVDHRLVRDELEVGGSEPVPHVVVVDAVALVPAVPSEHLVGAGDLLVEAGREGVVVGRLRHGRVVDVAGQARVLGQGVVVEDRLRDGADPVGRDDVAGERLPDELRAAGDAGERVVDRDVRRVGGEVPVAQRLGRDPGVGGGVEARADVLDALVADRDEGLVPPVVEARDANGTGEAEAGPVRGGVRLGLASRVPEEVVRRHALRLGEVVDRAVVAVRPRLDAHAGDAALGVAELGVEGGRLHLELLHHVGGRDVARDDLVLVRGGGARHAVDEEVAAVAARAVVGVPDDVGRLVRPVQPLVTRVGEAGREAHDLVGVAVDQRQLRDALLVHREADAGVRVVQREALRGDADGFLQAPDLERDGQVAGLADLEQHVVLDVLLEARDLDRHLVGAREQEADLEQAVGVGRRGGRRASRRVRDGHGRPGDRRLGGVRHPAGDSPACLLSLQGQGEDEKRQQEGQGAVHASGRGTFAFHVNLPSAAGAGPDWMPRIERCLHEAFPSSVRVIARRPRRLSAAGGAGRSSPVFVFTCSQRACSRCWVISRRARSALRARIAS